MTQNSIWRWGSNPEAQENVHHPFIAIILCPTLTRVVVIFSVLSDWTIQFFYTVLQYYHFTVCTQTINIKQNY